MYNFLTSTFRERPPPVEEIGFGNTPDRVEPVTPCSLCGHNEGKITLAQRYEMENINPSLASCTCSCHNCCPCFGITDISKCMCSCHRHCITCGCMDTPESYCRNTDCDCHSDHIPKGPKNMYEDDTCTYCGCIDDSNSSCACECHTVLGVGLSSTNTTQQWEKHQLSRLNTSNFRRSIRILESMGYLFVKGLGEGCYGTVGLYLDSSTKKYVAIKSINANKYDPKEEQINAYLTQSLGENIRFFSISHSLNTGSMGSQVFLVSEPMDMNLSTFEETEYRIIGTTERERVAKLIIAQLVQGIFLLHSIGIVHSDFKLDQCFIDKKNGRIMIGDFGYSGVLVDDGHGGKKWGTTPKRGASALIPINCRSDRQITYYNDIYSLAINIILLLNNNIGNNILKEVYNFHKRQLRRRGGYNSVSIMNTNQVILNMVQQLQAPEDIKVVLTDMLNVNNSRTINMVDIKSRFEALLANDLGSTTSSSSSGFTFSEMNWS